MHSNHCDVAIVEVVGNSVAAVRADSKRRFPGANDSRVREFADLLSINEDAFHCPVPGADNVMPALNGKQPRFAFVKRRAIEFTTIIGDECDTSTVDEQPDPTLIGIVMLGYQPLPAAQRERANPALQSQ